METIYLIIKNFTIIGNAILFEVFISSKAEFNLANIQIYLKYQDIPYSGSTFEVELFQFDTNPLITHLPKLIGFAAYTKINNGQHITVSTKELLIARCKLISDNVHTPFYIKFNEGELRTKIFYKDSSGLILQSSNNSFKIINDLENAQ